MSIPLTIDSLKNYYILDKIVGEGTFSKVVKSKRVSDNELIALKVFKKKLKSILDVDSLREVQVFRAFVNHPNIITAHRYIYDPVSSMFCIEMELMTINLYEYLSKRYTTEEKTKFIIFNILKGLEFMHSKAWIHRDIKPENILLNGDATSVKIADLGSCTRIYTEKRPLTQYIATRWYRAPENLLTSGLYDEKMDIWGISLIMFEILTRKPLFPGKDAIEQISLIHKALGSPSESELYEINRNRYYSLPFTFPKMQGSGIRRMFLTRPSEYCMKFIEDSLIYSPVRRPTAADLLTHPFLMSLNQTKNEIRSQRSESLAAVVFSINLEKIIYRRGQLTADKIRKCTFK